MIYVIIINSQKHNLKVSFSNRGSRHERYSRTDRQVATELDTDWMHPWIGLDWIAANG